jgi:transposase
MPKASRVVVSAAQRRELEWRIRSRTLRADDVRRARLVLMVSEGESYEAIQETLGCSSAYVARWSARFVQDGLAGLYSRHRGRKAQMLTPRMEARILEWTRRKPTDGSTHWSTRKLAKALGVSHMLVARVWSRAGLKPHRIERYMLSTDPHFEDKAADIIGLYLKPPQHAAVFCVDEKTAIQALDRLDPVLPLSPGRAERHGFEYYRHGTLSLYAALNTQSGEVFGKTVDRHTSEEFVAFLTDVVASQPRGREIHIIADNLSAHKTRRVEQFLATHRKVHLHFTPTYSSWLNQVELWFSKIERDVIMRGVFTSVKDLARKLMRYIRRYNLDPKPIKWTYRDPSNRIRGFDSSVTVH